MTQGQDTLRFTVMADTVDGVRDAAGAYLLDVGADYHAITFEIGVDTYERSDGTGIVTEMTHGPLRAEVTAWLHRKGTR